MEFVYVDSNAEHIYLCTDELGLDLLVKTDRNQFDRMLEICEAVMDREDAAHIFKKVWSVIKNTDVDKIYDVQPAWGKFCDDIAVFFTVRWVLFKKPVPIVKQSIVKRLTRQGYEDPTEIED